MFQWLRNYFTKLPSGGSEPAPKGFTPPIPHPDPIGAIRWMDANDPENSFGIRVINCYSTAMGLLSTTQDPAIAETYGLLRSDDGRRHIGKVPDDPIESLCDLRYPLSEPLRDGRFHVSTVMEDKWDICLYRGTMYFSRSWRGNLVYTAGVESDANTAYIRRVTASRADAFDNPIMAVRQVDFLIKSHLLGWRVPAPLPPNSRIEDTKIVAMSLFGSYGRHAIAGTYEDTLHLAPSTKIGATPASPTPNPPPAPSPPESKS